VLAGFEMLVDPFARLRAHRRRVERIDVVAEAWGDVVQTANRVSELTASAMGRRALARANAEEILRRLDVRDAAIIDDIGDDQREYVFEPLFPAEAPVEESTPVPASASELFDAALLSRVDRALTEHGRSWPVLVLRFHEFAERPPLLTLRDALNQEGSVLLDLSQLPDPHALRMLDFSAGLAFAERALLSRISDRLFLIMIVEHGDSDSEGAAIDAMRQVQ